MIDKCKLAASVGLAALAGITALAAGLMGEVRASVVLGRTLCSFLITGVLVYIGVFLFERFGFRALLGETGAAMERLDAEEGPGGDAGEPAGGAGEGEGAGEAKTAGTAGGESEPGNGFEPLQADSLRRVVGSDNAR